MIVADTDLLSYLVVAGKRSQAAAGAFDRDSDWVAPANQRVELLNVLSKHMRSGQLDQAKAIDAFARATRLCQVAVEAASESELLSLAFELKTTTYDSAFVWLARHRRLRIVTGDKGLIACAPDVAVSIEDFAEGR